MINGWEQYPKGTARSWSRCKLSILLVIMRLCDICSLTELGGLRDLLRKLKLENHHFTYGLP